MAPPVMQPHPPHSGTTCLEPSHAPTWRVYWDSSENRWEGAWLRESDPARHSVPSCSQNALVRAPMLHCPSSHALYTSHKCSRAGMLSLRPPSQALMPLRVLRTLSPLPLASCRYPRQQQVLKCALIRIKRLPCLFAPKSALGYQPRHSPLTGATVAKAARPPAPKRPPPSPPPGRAQRSRPASPGPDSSTNKELAAAFI